LRAGPALGCAKNDHRPAWARLDTVFPRIRLNAMNFVDDRVQRGGHELMHLLRLIPLDEVRRVAIAAEQLIQLLMAETGENGRIGDLVAVQVEGRPKHAGGHGGAELVGMPRPRPRPSLRLPVPAHTSEPP